MQRHAQLLGELARQIQGDTAKVGVTQEVVEVVGQKLKDQTEVVAKYKALLQLNYKTTTTTTHEINNWLGHNTVQRMVSCATVLGMAYLNIMYSILQTC